jgi:hypothetical protein
MGAIPAFGMWRIGEKLEDIDLPPSGDIDIVVEPSPSDDTPSDVPSPTVKEVDPNMVALLDALGAQGDIMTSILAGIAAGAARGAAAELVSPDKYLIGGAAPFFSQDKREKKKKKKKKVNKKMRGGKGDL